MKNKCSSDEGYIVWAITYDPCKRRNVSSNELVCDPRATIIAIRWTRVAYGNMCESVAYMYGPVHTSHNVPYVLHTTYPHTYGTCMGVPYEWAIHPTALDIRSYVREYVLPVLATKVQSPRQHYVYFASFEGKQMWLCVSLIFPVFELTCSQGVTATKCISVQSVFCVYPSVSTKHAMNILQSLIRSGPQSMVAKSARNGIRPPRTLFPKKSGRWMCCPILPWDRFTSYLGTAWSLSWLTSPGCEGLVLWRTSR